MNRTRLSHRIGPALIRSLPVLAVLLGAASAPASAQVFVRPFYYSESWSGPLVRPIPEGPGRLPMGEIFEDLRDQGFRPVGVVSRGRETVTVEAVDRRERRLHLTVDVYDGEIVSRRVLASTRMAPPASPHIRPVPETSESPPRPPRKKLASPTPSEQRSLPGARRDTTPEATPPKGPVAPARDPSQWGKQG